MASVRVKIGDAIEFAAQDAAENSSSPNFTSGRIMDVNPQEPERCTVQISPYEPLRNLNLQHHAFKIVYTVGDITVLSPRVKDWQIEIKSDMHQDAERRVVKRIDSDINCALVAFESGKKEWLDLTLSAFKVIVEQQQQGPESNLVGSIALNQDPSQHTEVMEDQVSAPDDEFQSAYQNGHTSIHEDHHTMTHAMPKKLPTIPILALPKCVSSSQEGPQMSTQFASKAPPDSDPITFDRYAEGGHAELCDIHGGFVEGAILCAKSDTHMHLYNENHQFFEVPMMAQSFKVIIHGLLSLKSISIGQTVEVYSAMTGAFRPGTVIKIAEVSKLAPIRYADGAVEWIDLSTQTFKLVFLSGPSRTVAESNEVIELESPQHLESPDDRHHHHHASPLTLLALTINQRIEVSEAKSKQYTKYTVVDVIVNAKIVKVGSIEENHHEPAMLVRYKDGQKRRIHVHSVKIKLRLREEPLSSDGGELHNSLHHNAMTTSESATVKSDIELKSSLYSGETGETWEHSAIPPGHGINRPTTKSDLSRSRSEHHLPSSATTGAIHPPHLTHFASSNDLHTDKFLAIDSIQMTQTIPSIVHRLDFSTLHTFANSPMRESEKDESAYAVATSATPPSSSAASSNSARSNHTSSRVAYTMDDLWEEELGESSNGDSGVVYVHVATGVRRLSPIPEWLRRSDPSTGQLVVVHTATNTTYTLSGRGISSNRANASALGSARSLSRRESSSGGRSVPIGPLEAELGTMTMLLRGKRALVVGLMNKHSLAASVTQALLSRGAQVVVSSKSPLTESQRKACGFHAPSSSSSSTDPTAGSDAAIIAPSLHFRESDVEDDASIEALISECGAIFDGQLDILVHSIAFAPRETFAGPGGILATSKSAWQQTMDVSAYSLIALTRAAYPLLSSGMDGSLARDRSILTLSYAGASKVVPNYNVMGPAKAALEATSRQLAHELGPEGIRVNCLSPGPMNTVSARGIPGISVLLTLHVDDRGFEEQWLCFSYANCMNLLLLVAHAKVLGRALAIASQHHGA
ncbi:Short-chain dehydrogenase reductase sdr, partial [Globisporangium splendens]